MIIVEDVKNLDATAREFCEKNKDAKILYFHYSGKKRKTAKTDSQYVFL